jgi:hypothetical protein
MASTRKIFAALLYLLCSLVALQAPVAVAETYYVDSNIGNDLNSGLGGSPWQTIQKAANTLQPGDEVLVENGSYAGFHTARNGTPTTPIVFKANGNSVVLYQQNSSTSDVINIEGHDYNVIDGFIIQSGGRSGVRVVDARGVIVRNNIIGPTPMWGIFTGFTPEIQIIDNVCYDAAGQHGIYVSNSRDANDNPIVRGNECYGNYMNGIQFNGDCHSSGDGTIVGAIIEDNFVHDNGWKGFSLISLSGSVIQNNITANNGTRGAGAGGIHLADEPDCNNPSNDNLVVNNTVYEPVIAGMRMTNGSTNNTFFNNLVIASSTDRTIIDESGGNLIDSSTNLRYASTSGLFVNAGGNDYHLSSSSPAIGGGVATYNGRPAPNRDFEGTARPSGGSYDVGADEFLGAGGGTPPTVAMTEPVNGTSVSGAIMLAANATDDVQVAGVQFRVDGNAWGTEVSTSPYEISFNTTLVADGPTTLEAEARDGEGYTSVSAPVSVTVQNNTGNTGILPDHPRLFFYSGMVANIRAKACYDANGNPIGGCSPSDDWTRFYSWINSSSPTYPPRGGDYLLAYYATQNSSYAQDAISLADETIADMKSERGDSYLKVHRHVKNVAMVYDLLYDQLSPSQRTAYTNYMNQVMTELWNPFDNPYNEWSGWSINNPGNNYYYAFMMATAFAALALYNDNPSPPSLPYDGTTYNDIYEFLEAKLTGQMVPYLQTYGKGGGWHEGVNYRLGSLMHMYEMFMVLRNAGGPDYFQDISYPRENLYYNLYIIQPGNEYLYPGGDLARSSSMPLSSDDRMLMLFLADGLKGQIESQYAQYFLENVFTEMASSRGTLFGYDLALGQNLPNRNIAELPNSYLAEGQGWVNSRSSWTSDAVSASFVSTDRIQDHQHRDQNSFVIYKEGWQAPDAVTWSHSGIIQSTSLHNTIIVDGAGQLSGEGTGEVLKYKATDEYSYVVGDATDAYYGSGSKNAGDPPLLDVFQRELVHVYPDFVVVFDRITSKSAGTDVEYLIHSHNTPSIQGTLVTTSEGAGKLFHKTLLPTNATLTTVSESYGNNGAQSSYRVEIKPQAPVQNHINLNVMYAGSAAAGSMPPADLFSTETDNMVGAKLDVGGTDVILMFTKDPTGAAPQGNVIYEIGRAPETRHHLMGLKLATRYSIEIVEHGETLMVVVREGDGPMTSTEGTLSFTTGGVTPKVALETKRN